VKPSPPFIPGHEAVGVIPALGPNVTGLKEGDPVGVAWLHDACMNCEYCETGWETLCEQQHNTGYSCNGGFAEYVIGAASFVGRLPAGADFAQMAPILCAGVTTYKGLKETEARPGQWVAISGVGGLGQVVIQYAKAMGLHVAALDVAPEKTRPRQSQRSRSGRRRPVARRGGKYCKGHGRRGARRARHRGLTAGILSGTADGPP
jgi:propanol-preferring alcohol dehydrogenase